MNENIYYYIRIEAEDENGGFFQNFYVNVNSEDVAINKLLDYIDDFNYQNVRIDNPEKIDDVFGIEELEYMEELPGYIQLLKFGYDEYEENEDDDDKGVGYED